MGKIKVFISSVIENYKDRRDAAEEAILELNRDHGFNFEAIRIESKKYPAVNKTPQKACIDGVKECDIYLGIYPRNKSSSPTEEEFGQAGKDKKCRFVFIENTKDIDPIQSEFFKEFKGWESGHFYNEFESGNVDQLKHMVYRALRNFMKTNFEECRLNYLNAILKQYKQINRPWECSLPVSEIVQLELILIEEKQEEKELSTKYDENERHLEKLQKSLLFSDVIQENLRLLIIGDPGAGKSTSLQGITYTYAEQILSSTQKELPVPIYLELIWYNNSLLKLIATCFRENDVKCDEETITDWIEKEKFIFLLDGFDELDKHKPSKCLKEIKQLIASSRESQFVVASRKIEHLKDFQNLHFKKVEVKPLSDSQIELFIENYLGKEKGSKLLKELEKNNLLKEARNPLILWFMILEFQREESQISINKGMLFKNVIEHRFLEHWERKHAKDDNQRYTDLKITILSQLAFSMIEKGNSVKIKEEKAEEIIYSLLKEGRRDYKELGDTIKEQLLASHILIKVGTQVSFWHKSFRDYFAALELLKLFSRDPEEFVKQYVTKRWEESILFLVGIMDDPSDFVDRLVQPFWQYFLNYRSLVFFRLSLAAKCVGANNRISIKTQQKVIGQLTSIIQIWESKEKIRDLLFPIVFHVEEAFQALGETKSETVAELMGMFLENHKCADKQWQSCSFCQWAVKALREVPLTEKAQNSLLYAALWHKDGAVSWDAMEIIRENWENLSQRVISKLVQKVGDINEETEIRKRALYTIRGYDLVHAMERKYPDEVLDTFIKMALEEECDDLRTSAASALCYYKEEDKEERIVNPLIHALLKNPKHDIRANAAYALVYQSSNKVPKALIQALYDEDGKVLRYAAHSLAYIHPNTSEDENDASQRLLRLFDHKDTDVRINALWSYKFIRKTPTDEEITKLINLLEDGNISIRYEAAEALGRLKARAALGALIQLVFDEKYAEPWASAIWAIVQIVPSFSEVVKEKGWEDAYIDMLSDENIEKRRFAATVLRRIGTEKALPALKEMDADYEKKRGMNGKLFYAIRDIEARIRP